MIDSKKIAVVTPNPDTFTNPTMSALFYVLKEKGVDVYLFGPEQQPACPSNLSNVIVVPSHFKLNLFKNPKDYISQLKSYCKIFRFIRKNNIRTLLAVDPLGLIIGGRIKRFIGKKIHLSYLSFEIFFKKELSGHYLNLKEKEIYYSSFVDSLLVQDEKRKELLLQENKMNLLDKQIALVPVSPMKIEVSDKIDLYERLKISRDKKLAVYSGSVGNWCGTDAIIEAFEKGYWDTNYHLVFHTRKPLKEGDLYFEELTKLDKDNAVPFSLHPHPFDGFDELSAFLVGFDLALALYYPNNNNPYYGMNMKEIGLSSGKFSTYMMLGLPTIVTSCSIYDELLTKYAFGAVLTDIKKMKESFKQIEIKNNETAKLYEELLSPVLGMGNYIDIII
jgi:hypothetical protein